jgi:hypothetical protein
MAAQKVKPDTGTMERRDPGQTRRQTYAKVGAYGLVTIVFVVVTAAGFDLWNSGRTPDPVALGRTSIGPAVTSPAETGPVETGPTVAPDNRPDDLSSRIPPAGTAVSTPVEGKLIADAYVGFAGQIRVYADGRVLSAESGSSPLVEQRLSPEGVELVRRFVGKRVHLGYGLGHLPDTDRLASLLGDSGGIWSRQSAWEDREGKPYVPARYAACPHSELPPGDEALLDLLPASAQALLRGSDPALKQGACFDLAPVEARSLVAILSDAGSFKRDPWPLAVGAWSVSDGKGDRVTISLHPLFPDGQRFFRVPF